MQPVELHGDRRLYHAAAVIAGSFSALMLKEGATVLARAGFPDEQAKAMLAPLAIASLRNMVRTDNAMTGPASRGDERTIASHRDALNEHDLVDGVMTVYDILSAQIKARLGHD